MGWQLVRCPPDFPLKGENEKNSKKGRAGRERVVAMPKVFFNPFTRSLLCVAPAQPAPPRQSTQAAQQSQTRALMVASTRSRTGAAAASDNRDPQTERAPAPRKRQASDPADDVQQMRPLPAGKIEELCNAIGAMWQASASNTIVVRGTVTKGESPLSIDAVVTVEPDPFSVKLQTGPLAMALPMLEDARYMQVHSHVPRCFTLVLDPEGDEHLVVQLHVSNATDFVRVLALLEAVQHPTPLRGKTVRTPSGDVGVVTSSAKGGNVVVTVLQPSMRRLTEASDDLATILA